MKKFQKLYPDAYISQATVYTIEFNTIAVFLPIKSANIPAGTMVSITIPV